MSKKDKGAISIFALLSMMFFLIFIMVAYNNVMQKGKNQVELEEILVDYYNPVQTVSEIIDAKNGGDRIKMTDLRGNEQKFEMLKSANNDKYIYSNGKIYKIEANKKEYQEVEYIESTGTQYIDTGWYANNNTIVNARLYTEQNSNQNWFGGSGYSSTNYVFNAYRINTIETSFGNVGWELTGVESNVVGTVFDISFGKTVKINGDIIKTFNEDNIFTDTRTIQLFTRNRDTFSSGISGRIYYLNIYDGDNLVRDFIPCYRVSDGVVGLYDLVNNEFYTNIGTGTFSKGPDV